MKAFTANKKLTVLSVAAALLVLLCIPVRYALAYFTDYQKAEGSSSLNLSWSTELHETIENEKDKAIVIENNGDTDVIVRVQIFAGDYAEITDHQDWTKSGDWWYYTRVLPKGGETPVLRAVVHTDNAPADDFNIIVVHESARVVYETNTKLMAPGNDWEITPTAGGEQQ